MMPRLKIFIVLVFILIGPAVSSSDEGMNTNQVEVVSGVDFGKVSELKDSKGEPACTVALTGAGVRKKFFFKIYAGAHYIEEGVQPSGNDLNRWIVEGNFCKKCVMHFLMTIPKERMRSEFRTNIRTNLTPSEAVELSGEIDRLADLFREDSKKGAEVTVSWIPGDGLSIFSGDELLGNIKDERIMRAVWALWFGDNPVSKSLKKDFTEELEQF